MPGPQTLFDWITPALAIWGALLSTMLAIREFSKDRKRIVVKSSTGALQSGRMHGRNKEIFTIRAINTGYRPVQITAAGFVLSNSSEMQCPMDVAGNYPLPKVISDGESVTVTCYLDSLQKSIEEGRKKDPMLTIKYVFVRDAENKVYRGPVPKVLQARKLSKHWCAL